MGLVAKACYVLAILAGLLVPTLAADKAIIVLDGSGSMWAQIEGQARITLARDTLGRVLQSMPPDLELGLMTYGRRDKGDCNDIELLVPPAAGTRDAIIAAAGKINPKGKTPLSEAVRQAAVELRYTEDKATVILITDGLETCEADPCALASELERSGVDFTTYVLGLGLSDEEGREVACIAENTGGQYFAANDVEALTQALTTTVAAISLPIPQMDPPPDVQPEPEPEPEPVALTYNLAPDVLMAKGSGPLSDTASIAWEIYHQTSDGGRGEYVSTSYSVQYTDTLEPGDYLLVARMGQVEREQPITVTDTAVTAPTIVLNAAILTLHPLRMAGDDPAGEAAVTVTYDGGQATQYGDGTMIVPAGEIAVEVTIGEGSVTETFTARPGETIERDIIVGVGRTVVNASYVEGMAVDDASMAIEILAARKAIDGSRKSVAYGYGSSSGFDLPPGDYLASVTMGLSHVEVPFTVEAGQLTEVDAPLNAGVIAITAPGAKLIEIFAAKKDIQGNRKQLGYNYSDSYQTTLPAGEYTIVATMGDDMTREVPGSITAGERTEVSILE